MILIHECWMAMYPINELGGIKNQSHSYYGFLEGLFCVTRPIEAHHEARTTSCNFDAFALRRREAAYICVLAPSRDHGIWVALDPHNPHSHLQLVEDTLATDASWTASAGRAWRITCTLSSSGAVMIKNYAQQSCCRAFREASTFIFDPPLAEFTSRHV